MYTEKTNPTSAEKVFDGFLSYEIIKISLVFYYSVGMFQNGLPSAIHLMIISDSNLVLIN